MKLNICGLVYAAPKGHKGIISFSPTYELRKNVTIEEAD